MIFTDEAEIPVASTPDAGIDRRAGREADSSGPDWILQWDSLLAEPEFNAMVDDIVTAACRRSSLPRDCVDDVRQEMFLRLAAAFRRRPDLGYDPTRGPVRPFLWILLWRMARRSVPQFAYRFTASIDTIAPDHDRLTIEETAERDRRIDRILAVNRLPDPLRYVMTRWLEGRTSIEIARELNLSRRTTYRRIEQGRQQLATLLADPDPDIPHFQPHP